MTKRCAFYCYSEILRRIHWKLRCEIKQWHHRFPFQSEEAARADVGAAREEVASDERILRQVDGAVKPRASLIAGAVVAGE
jgi:hypothetical protein